MTLSGKTNRIGWEGAILCHALDQGMVGKQIKDFTYAFNHQLAGDYHHYAVEAEVSEDTLSEYKEAFESYHIAKSVDPINEIGDILCNYYYQIQQFRIALNYGTRTEEIAGNKTHGRVYSHLGLIFQIFGHLDFALQYQKKSLEDVKRKEDRQGEGTTLNNISRPSA